MNKARERLTEMPKFKSEGEEATCGRAPRDGSSSSNRWPVGKCARSCRQKPSNRRCCPVRRAPKHARELPSD